MGLHQQQQQQLYQCPFNEHWRRQIGQLSPCAFMRTIGGCEDLIQRLVLDANLDGHDGCVNTVHFSPSGELLVSGSDDRKIVFWDWSAQVQKLSYNSGHDNNVFQAKIMPFSNNHSVVSCAADGQIRHGQVLGSGRVETRRLGKHKGRAHKLSIEPASPHRFLSCGEDGVVNQFDLREDKGTRLFVCHSFHLGSSKPSHGSVVRLNSIVINPRNTNYFSVGGSDEFARVYDIRRVNVNASSSEDQPVDSFTPKHLLGTSKDPHQYFGQVHITCVAYSHQEELLVSYNDELIYSFDKDMGLGPNPKERQHTDDMKGNDIDSQQDCPGPQVFEGHRNAQTVKGVNYFGPNTEYVVSGSDCGRIFIWKKKGGKLLALLKGDSQVVNCLEPHPYATILATSGIDRTIKVWAPTAPELLPLPCDVNMIMEENHRRRQDRSHNIPLTPDLIMHVLRFQRRHTRTDSENQYTQMSDDNDDDDMECDSADEESVDDVDTANSRECTIS